nr:hypothetical protein MFLOJ_08660 [Mycobacterium florentinum]
MNIKVQKACAWGGAAFALAFLIGFWVIARFIPPPSPASDAQQIANFFAQHQTGIRLGMIITMLAASLMAPWIAVISIQLKRIEGPFSPLAYAQLALGAALMVEFLLPLMIWEAAAFRPTRSPEIVQFANDVSWLTYVGLTSTGVAQAAVIAVAILSDRRAVPVFPRAVGYFNIWIALLFTPGSVNVFFKHGPLAWNGLIAWYLVLAAFSIWLPVMTWQLIVAINRQAADEPPTNNPDADSEAVTLQLLAAELAEIRLRVARTQSMSPK